MRCVDGMDCTATKPESRGENFGNGFEAVAGLAPAVGRGRCGSACGVWRWLGCRRGWNRCGDRIARANYHIASGCDQPSSRRSARAGRAARCVTCTTTDSGTHYWRWSIADPWLAGDAWSNANSGANAPDRSVTHTAASRTNTASWPNTGSRADA